MTGPSVFRLLPVLFLVAACAAAEVPGASGGGTGNLPGAGGAAADTPEDDLVGVELCDAKKYRPLVGTPVSAATFPVGPRLRVYGIDDVVTQEYLPNRTNVVHDRNGVILRVFCG